MKQDVPFADRTKSIPRSFLRDIFNIVKQPGMISFGGGFPNPDFLPTTEFASAAERAFEEEPRELMQYGNTEGYEPLRTFISNQYHAKENLHITVDEILITTGAQQGIDMVGKIFINRGDIVLVENPTYLAAIQAFSAYGAHFIPVTLEQDGPNIAELEAILKKHSPKLFYTNPNFQNPTGITHSTEKRKQVAALLESHGTIILEDDPYGEIRFAGERQETYKSIYERTVLLGSFSKTVAPGLRLGWAAASEEIITKLVTVKQAADLLSSNLGQHILYRYVRDNDTDSHILRIAEGYKAQKQYMMDAIKKYLPENTVHTNPEGGMFTWVTLPGIDTRKLFELAVAEGVVFAPGESFFADNPQNDTMRLNYTNATPESIEEGMERLKRAINTYQQ
jgi:2-aminoadipate transaminase